MPKYKVKKKIKTTLKITIDEVEAGDIYLAIVNRNGGDFSYEQNILFDSIADRISRNFEV